MPKIVTEEEKKELREAMYHHTIQLIKEKGMKKITVEDIIQAVGIAKGTFYNYYRSKEELLFHVIQKSEQKLFQTILAIDYKTGDFREKVTTALKEIYLSKDSIVLYLRPEDMESLTEKLPAKAKASVEQKQTNNFQQIAELFGIDSTDLETFGVISYLMDCLHFTAVNVDYGKQARQISLELIVDTFADFLVDKKTKKEHN